MSDLNVSSLLLTNIYIFKQNFKMIVDTTRRLNSGHRVETSE